MVAHLSFVIALSKRNVGISFLAASNLIVVKLHPKSRPIGNDDTTFYERNASASGGSAIAIECSFIPEIFIRFN